MKAWLNKGEVGAAELNRQQQCLFRVLGISFSSQLHRLSLTPSSMLLSARRGWRVQRGETAVMVIYIHVGSNRSKILPKKK